MRKILNKWLYKKGYEIVKIGQTPYLLEQISRAKGSPINFLQIGANDGVSFDNLYSFVTSNQCAGVVVEPLPDFFERLTLNYAHYPKIKPVQVAIHPELKSTTIFRVSRDQLQNYQDWTSGIASFSKQHLTNLSISEEDIESVEVPCMGLMELIDVYSSGDIDYLQIDTEGFDYEVLKQLDFSAIKPKLIKFEKVHMKIEDFESLTTLLQSNDYKIIDDNRDSLALLR